MNLSSPPPDCNQYTKKLYEFLKSPVFDQLRLKPRATAPDGPEGTLYYHVDDGFQIKGGTGYSSIGSGAYVPRTEGSGWDWDTDDGDFSGTLGSLDISSIVPSKAYAIQTRVYLYTNLDRCNPADDFWFFVSSAGAVGFQNFMHDPVFSYHFMLSYCSKYTVHDTTMFLNPSPLVAPVTTLYWQISELGTGSNPVSIENIKMVIQGWWI